MRPLPRAAWRDAASAIAAAWVFAGSRRDDAALPASAWAALTHWRLGAAAAPLHAQYEVAGERGTRQARVAGSGSRVLHVHLGDTQRRVAFGAAHMLTLDGVALALAVGEESAGDGRRIWVGDGRHTEWVTVRPALRSTRGSGAAAGAALVAPMTGKVLEVRVRDGDAVHAGQVLVLIESMKMEMRVAAPHAGIARAVGTTVGTTVERGAVLLSVEAAEEGVA